MEIGLSEVIKFCTRKLIKRTHFMSALKIINLFQDMMSNFSLKNVGLEVSRPVIFMINRTQLISEALSKHCMSGKQCEPLYFCWGVESPTKFSKTGQGGLT